MQETERVRGVEVSTGEKGQVARERPLARSPISPAHLAQIRRIAAALFRPQLD